MEWKSVEPADDQHRVSRRPMCDNRLQPVSQIYSLTIHLLQPVKLGLSQCTMAAIPITMYIVNCFHTIHKRKSKELLLSRRPKV